MTDKQADGTETARIYKYCADGKEDFRNDFRKYFPDIRMEGLVDAFISACLGRIVINVSVFSDLISMQYPEEWEYKSLTEIVRDNYGTSAMEFLDTVLC